MGFKEKEKYSVDDLVEIVKVLRAPDGCPWDQKQTHESIRNNFIEETYEVIEAIDTKDTDLLKEELGDVLLQVIFHAEMESEADKFDFQDVCDGICKKLVFRHPHVFGEDKAVSAEDALGTWEMMKRIEKHQETATQTLQQVSKALPALMYSKKVQKRASTVGFCYPNTEGALADLESELLELKEAITENNPEHMYEELGDLLFSCVNVARFLKVDAEQSLYDSSAKFIDRVTKVERLMSQRGMVLGEADLLLLNSLWEEAKNIN